MLLQQIYKINTIIINPQSLPIIQFLCKYKTTCLEFIKSCIKCMIEGH